MLQRVVETILQTDMDVESITVATPKFGIQTLDVSKRVFVVIRVGHARTNKVEILVLLTANALLVCVMVMPTTLPGLPIRQVSVKRQVEEQIRVQVGQKPAMTLRKIVELIKLLRTHHV